MARKATVKRTLLKNGTIVLRFRGYEIFRHKDPAAVATFLEGFQGGGR